MEYSKDIMPPPIPVYSDGNISHESNQNAYVILKKLLNDDEMIKCNVIVLHKKNLEFNAKLSILTIEEEIDSENVELTLTKKIDETHVIDPGHQLVLFSNKNELSMLHYDIKMMAVFNFSPPPPSLPPTTTTATTAATVTKNTGMSSLQKKNIKRYDDYHSDVDINDENENDENDNDEYDDENYNENNAYEDNMQINNNYDNYFSENNRNQQRYTRKRRNAQMPINKHFKNKKSKLSDLQADFTTIIKDPTTLKVIGLSMITFGMVHFITRPLLKQY
ncbi:hypothetical protein PV326_001627 [Microctonus aethiopoides]|nr:hypothetical protein PV326_001627 [Microctonus aethiopoides]